MAKSGMAACRAATLGYPRAEAIAAAPGFQQSRDFLGFSGFHGAPQAVNYHSAGALEPARRSAFLDRACQGDDELRREVESLLGQAASHDGVLERVAEDAGRAWPCP